MPNLKPYYDAALKADEKVKSILAEMDAAFNDGTPEGKEKALSLRPALDEAKAKAQEANEMYVSVRDASLTEDSMAPLFAAAADPAQGAEAEKPKAMTRAEYNALAPRDRLAFAKGGGQLTD